MAETLNDIINALPVGRRRKIEKRAAILVAEEMTLQELRCACEMTQIRMAKSLGVAQKQISEIEKRTDMHISTLRRSIEAMGGNLSFIVEFPDRAPVALSGIGFSIEKGSSASSARGRTSELRSKRGQRAVRTAVRATAAKT